MSTSFNTNSDTAQKTKKRLSMTLICSTAILFSLTSFVLAPLYTYTCSDVIFSVTVLPEIIEIIMDIIDVVTYAICLSTIIYSIFKFSFKGSLHLGAIYCTAVFLKYTANLVLTFIFDGTIGFNDFLYVIIYFIMDEIVLLLVSALSSSFIRKYYEKKALTEKANNRLGIKNVTTQEEVFNTSKIFSRKNPLQASALTMGVILSIIKILSRIRYDIYIGAPASVADAMWMSAYYLSDLLIIPIAYAIAWLMVSRFEKKEQEDISSSDK